MLKRISKITKKIIIVSVIVAVIVLLLSSLLNLIFIKSIVISGRSAVYIDDYSEFYLYKKDYKPLFTLKLPGSGGGDAYQVRFLLGQKQKLLEKIKEDVNIELTDLIANNSDIFKSYTISDDFKKINIYYYKDMYNDELNPESAHRIYVLVNKLSQETVALKVELYHQLIHGYANVQLSNIIVESEES